MGRVDAKSVEYILRELERLKIEIQRLEAMIIPVQRDPDIARKLQSYLNWLEMTVRRTGLMLKSFLNSKIE